ncbi:MAG: SMI1/KNR4 family protein [Phycisphaerae bacterium]|nr:SMI1/KNR4 family protein [Phycisphaerae bacterium]
MNAFRQFVEDNVRWFRGHAPESDESLNAAERVLGISLPIDVRWLLRDYGYWHATGISSLDETVNDTQLAREHVNLPDRFVVLYNHQDGGVILLDTLSDPATGQNRVYSVGWESIPDRIVDDIVYDSYLDYVRDVLDCERDFIAENDIDYDPTLYHDIT